VFQGGKVFEKAGIWLNGDIKLGEEIERRPWKEGEKKSFKRHHSSGHPQPYNPNTEDKSQLECLVKIVGLLPWRKELMKTWSSLRLQVSVVRGILKLPCIL